MTEFIPLGLRILDEQLVDADGRRCGRVEDLELDGGPGAPVRVTAILCGATAWKRRLPPSLSQLLPGDPARLRRVPWSEVRASGNEIELASREADLARAADTEAGAMALSQLLSAEVVGVGRVHEVVATRAAETELWSLHGVLVGRQALLQRLSYSPTGARKIRNGEMPENMVSWDRILRLDERGRLVVAR